MIDIFFRTVRYSEQQFLRTIVTTAPDTERAHAMIEVLCASDAPHEAPNAGGRASRRRGTVAKLIARRDQVLDREISEILKAKGSKPHAVASGRR